MAWNSLQNSRSSFLWIFGSTGIYHHTHLKIFIIWLISWSYMNNFLLETISNKYSLVKTIAINILVITLILFNWTILLNNAWAPWWAHKNMPCVIYPLRPYSEEKLVIYNTKKELRMCAVNVLEVTVSGMWRERYHYGFPWATNLNERGSALSWFSRDS